MKKAVPSKVDPKKQQPQAAKKKDAPESDKKDKPKTRAKGKNLSTLFQTLSKIWSTRSLQEIHNFDRQAYLRTYLLEFIVFLCFIVIVILTMTYLKPLNVFYLCHALKSVFFETPITTGKHLVTFKGIATKQQLWDYLNTSFLDGMYGENFKVYGNRHWFIDQNVLMGQIRMRQVRVKNTSCELPTNIRSKISECFGNYEPDNEAHNTLPLNAGKAFSDESRSSVILYHGMLADYSTSGYIVSLPNSKAQTYAVFETLYHGNWLDRGTRAVLVDFQLFNPGLNVFAVVTFAAEFSMTGGVFTSYVIRTIRFLNISPNSPSFYVLFIFFGFLCYYVAEEIIELLVLRDLYYRRVAALVDNVIVVSGLCVVLIMAFVATRQATIIDEIYNSPNYYHNMLYMGYIQEMADLMLGIHVFTVFIKLFKYLEVNQTLYKLSHTLYESSADLVGYSILFFFVILSFSLLGMLLFGYQLSIFSTLRNSIVSLFRMLLGDIEFEYIDDKHSIIGAAYLIIYIVTIYFILMNVFLAIIFESYSTVKESVNKRPFDFYLFDYIKRKFQKNKREESVVRMKCNQWVSDMLNQGYSEQAIEMMLRKHKNQGLKLETILNEHQIRTLTHELESFTASTFNYEYMAHLEREFKELQEDLQVVINELVKRQNNHKLAMVKLLDLIKKSKEPNDIKVNSIYNLVKNELAS